MNSTELEARPEEEGIETTAIGTLATSASLEARPEEEGIETSAPDMA